LPRFSFINFKHIKEVLTSNNLSQMVKKVFLFCLMAVLLNSCAPSEKIVYFNKAGGGSATEGAGTNFETRIKPDDNLIIIVSAQDAAAAEKFNLPVIGSIGAEPVNLESATSQNKFQTYLVNRNGEINFPTIGTVKLGGLTKEEALGLLYNKLSVYIKDAVINLRIANFKVSVLGEVLRPGSFTTPTERISVLDALSLAGDLTIYGNRQEVVLIRDQGGVKTFATLDLTQADIINSPYYYLQQNDQLYVKPNKTRVNSSAVGPNITVIISGISILIAVAAIVIK
jgi:polysaccharide biosynthesis/export protein